MKKITIIGAGQLGSRHLQGLALLHSDVEIFVVDPFEESLNTSFERYLQMETNSKQSVHLLSSICDLPTDLNLAILATTADVRYESLVKLLEHSVTENIILEKVLFQDLDDYPRALALDKISLDNVWVNFAQRLWPFFINLKRKFFDDPRLEIQISGSTWGLGCNSVHNVDIVDFLWSRSSLTEVKLDQRVLESKRARFVEFSGEVCSTVHGGGILRQVSYADGDAPFTISCNHPSMKQYWDVTHGVLYESNSENNWKMESSHLVAPYQSALTSQVVAKIFEGSDCGLPKLKNACETHMRTLEPILYAANAMGQSYGKVCPIT